MTLFQKGSSARWTAVWLLTALALGACSKPQPMRVEVVLDNRCELIDEAFMAVSEPDGKKADFERGRAVLHTSSDARILVKSHERYPAFRYESGKVHAAPKVTITTRCDDGERIDRTLDALRGQFKGHR